MTRVDVTLAVPTRNGGAPFRELLLRAAELKPRPAALLAFDSESSDGSPARAREAGFEVVSIPAASFDHGLTRQAMAERAATRFVAFLSQDALPEPGYLGPLVAALADDRTAAASARVLPRSSASPLARRTVLASPQASDVPACFECPPERRFAALTPEERRRLCRLDNVASLVRRDLLLRFPFPRTMMGEDVAFAAQAIAAGYRVRFEPRSVVFHSHEYGAIEAFRRYREDARFVRREFGLAVRPGPISVLRGVASEVVRDWKWLFDGAAPEMGAGVPTAAQACGWREFAAVLRSPWLRAWQVAGQWRGSRGADEP